MKSNNFRNNHESELYLEPRSAVCLFSHSNSNKGHPAYGEASESWCLNKTHTHSLLPFSFLAEPVEYMIQWLSSLGDGGAKEAAAAEVTTVEAVEDAPAAQTAAAGDPGLLEPVLRR